MSTDPVSPLLRTPTPGQDMTKVLFPGAPDVAPVPPRPGDIILVRAIKFWDSGQIQRVLWGIALSAAPIVYDLWNRNELTWRSAISAVVAGIFGYIGFKRAASPDVVTGIKALDKANAAAVAVPPVEPKPGA